MSAPPRALAGARSLSSRVSFSDRSELAAARAALSRPLTLSSAPAAAAPLHTPPRPPSASSSGVFFLSRCFCCLRLPPPLLLPPPPDSRYLCFHGFSPTFARLDSRSMCALILLYILRVYSFQICSKTYTRNTTDVSAQEGERERDEEI